MAKILVYSLVFPPDQVSNAHVLADLVRGLQRLGYEVKVLTTTPHYHILDDEILKQPLTPYVGKWIYKSDFEGTPCYHIKVPSKKGRIFQRILTMLLFHYRSLRFAKRAELDCDLVIAVSTPPTMGLMGPRIARFHRVPSVFIEWDILSENFITSVRSEKSVSVRFLKWIESRSYHANNAIASLSPTTTIIVRNRTPAKTIVQEIPTSVNTDLYMPRPRDNEYSRQHGWTDRFVVSYVGNMGQAQDFSVIPDIVNRCSDLPIKFIFAGSGLKCESLGEEAKKLDNPAWEVWGHQPIATTPWINSSSDLCLVLLSPNITKGSFPSKLYTIMACEKPVMYYGPCDTDIGRLIRDKRIGWTVETGDVDGFEKAIREAYENPDLLKEMGQRALAEVKNHYSAEAVAKQYDELIRRLLNDGSSQEKTP